MIRKYWYCASLVGTQVWSSMWGIIRYNLISSTKKWTRHAGHFILFMWLRSSVEYKICWRIISVGSEKNFHPWCTILKLDYLNKPLAIFTYFWNFWNLSYTWLWFHVYGWFSLCPNMLKYGFIDCRICTLSAFYYFLVITL